MCGVDSRSMESVVQNEVEVGDEVALDTRIGTGMIEKARGGKRAKLRFEKYGSYGMKNSMLGEELDDQLLFNFYFYFLCIFFA